MSDEEENTKRALKYLENMIKEGAFIQVTNNFLFGERTREQKLKDRIRYSNEFKKIGIEIPPDNIDITN